MGFNKQNNLSLKTKRPLICWIALLLLIFFHISTAIMGVNYGTHWDEHYIQTLLSNGIKDLNAWPQKYFYGSIYTAIGCLALAPEWLGSLPELIQEANKRHQYAGRVTPTPKIVIIQDELLKKVNSEGFLVRTRIIFLSFAVLCILWIYLAVKRLTSNSMVSLIAALVIGLSWEINTHSRHIAVDAIFTQFVALQLYLLICYLYPKEDKVHNTGNIIIAAVVAGIASGTKFIAITLIIPTIGAILTRNYRMKLKRKFQLIFITVLIALGLMILVNPGLILDTVQVANDWAYTAFDYCRPTLPIQDPYKTFGRMDHLGHIVTYVATDALSPFLLIGLSLFVIGIFGWVVSLRKNWRITLALSSFFPIHILILTGGDLFIVRNYLPLIPVMAIYIAIGMSLLLEKQRYRMITLFFIFTWIIMNSFHLLTTSLTVGYPASPSKIIQKVQDYIIKNADKKFLVIPSVENLANREKMSILRFSNTQTVRNDPVNGYYDFCLYTYKDFRAQAPNKPKLNYFTKVFGSQEVNFNYYPDWIGRNRKERIFVIDRSTAEILFEWNKEKGR